MKHKIIIVMCILILLVGCSNEKLKDELWDDIQSGRYTEGFQTNNKLLLDNGSLFRIADTNITSMLFTQPQGIIFTADYVTFTDGKLNITFDEELWWSFNNFSYIQWNIGNNTYKYIKEEKMNEDLIIKEESHIKIFPNDKSYEEWINETTIEWSNCTYIDGKRWCELK